MRRWIPTHTALHRGVNEGNRAAHGGGVKARGEVGLTKTGCACVQGGREQTQTPMRALAVRGREYPPSCFWVSALQRATARGFLVLHSPSVARLTCSRYRGEGTCTPASRASG
jgi:hypothetical protein